MKREVYQKNNNPNGRPKGSKNKFSYDVKKYIYNTIANDGYVNELLNDIDAVVEEKNRDIKSAIWEKLSGQTKDEDLNSLTLCPC
jgi:hypothetical protein